MLRRREPVLDDLLELLGRHARVRGHDDLDDRGLAARERSFHVALEQRGERLLVLPLRDAAARAPSPGRGRRAAGNTSAARPRACRRCRTWRCARQAARSASEPSSWSPCDELDDGLLGRAVVPRGQRVGLGLGANAEGEQGGKGKKTDNAEMEGAGFMSGPSSSE